MDLESFGNCISQILLCYSGSVDMFLRFIFCIIYRVSFQHTGMKHHCFYIQYVPTFKSISFSGELKEIFSISLAATTKTGNTNIKFSSRISFVYCFLFLWIWQIKNTIVDDREFHFWESIQFFFSPFLFFSKYLSCCTVERSYILFN